MQCVVLDLDDTLFLERDYIRSGFDAVGHYAEAVFGVRQFSSLAWAAFEKGVRGDIFDTVLAECGIRATPAEVADLVSIYRTHDPQIQVLPDGARFLQSLRADVFVGVITDGPLASQEAKVAALGATAWSDLTVFTEALGPRKAKPDPTSFLLVEEESGCQGRQCCYIADNPTKDFIAPRALGWRTIRIRRPTSLHVSMPSADDVDCEIESLDQLLEGEVPCKGA